MRVNKNSLYYLLPFLVFLLMFLFWQRSSTHFSSTEAGRSMPTFNLPILYHSEKRLTNEDLKGKVVLVNFWASWCSACIKEHPVLMWIKEKDQIPLIGIDFEDNTEYAKNVLKKIGNPYTTIAIDENGVMSEIFGVDMIPQTFLLDAHGKILYRHLGILTQDEWKNKILPLLEQTRQ